MRNVLTLVGKELYSYFVSPIAYVVLTGFIVLGGWFFFNLLSRFNLLVSLYSTIQGNPGMLERLNLNEYVIAPLLHNLSIVLVILVPMITMRGFAEEKRSGTYELLLTSPLRTGEIVLGKFLASSLLILLMIVLAGIFPGVLVLYGNPEIGVTLAGFLGLALVGVAFVAVGLLASSFTENQIIAAVGGLVALLMFYIIGWPADTAREILGPFLRYVSVTEHFAEMVNGVVDSKDVVYFVSVVVLALFLTQRSVESARWR